MGDGLPFTYSKDSAATKHIRLLFIVYNIFSIGWP